MTTYAWQNYDDGQSCHDFHTGIVLHQDGHRFQVMPTFTAGIITE